MLISFLSMMSTWLLNIMNLSMYKIHCVSSGLILIHLCQSILLFLPVSLGSFLLLIQQSCLLNHYRQNVNHQYIEKESRSFRNTVNGNGPIVDPCRTPRGMCFADISSRILNNWVMLPTQLWWFLSLLIISSFFS